MDQLVSIPGSVSSGIISKIDELNRPCMGSTYHGTKTWT